MKIKILGKMWNFVREKTPQNQDGFAEDPKTPNKRIVIRPRLSGERELDVIIHELLHAADWHKDEGWVSQVGSDIARVLWRLGYRKCGEENNRTDDI